MTKSFEKVTFDGFVDRNSGTVFSDILFNRCIFRGCVISHTHQPKHRSTIKNVQLLGCESIGSSLESAIVDGCVVDGLKSSELVQCWGAVFNETIVKGKIGRLMLSDMVSPGVAGKGEQLAFQNANRDYYSGVKWALDISNVEAEEVDIRGIPARLIRGNPETQVILTREAAMKGTWSNVDLSNTYWPTAIKLFLDGGCQDVMLVAPTRHRKFKALHAGLVRLKDAGIVS